MNKARGDGLDHAEFENWLKEQPQETATLIAVRAALRVFPIVTHTYDPNNPKIQFALLTARAILTAGVAAKMPTPEVRAAAADTLGTAFAAVGAAGAAVGAAIGAAVGAAADAARAARAAFAAARAAAGATDAAARAAGAGAGAVYAAADAAGAAYLDTEILVAALFKTPIWHDRGEPDWLRSRFPPGENILESGPEWVFWRDWYQGFADGEPLDWELQRRVALIPDEDWEKGPVHIAGLIEGIEAEFLSAKLPQAETVEFDDATGKFFVRPIPVAKPDLLGATLSQIEDALGDALANPSNGLNENSRETRVLRRVFAKYGNDPQRIEMDLASVHAGLTRQIVGQDLPPSEENLALQSAVEQGARAIRATHPEVAENRRILSDQAMRELTPDEKQVLDQALPMLRDISRADLAEEWDQDIPVLINDTLGHVPDSAPRLPGADEATRIFSRVSKMAILMRRSSEIIKRTEESTGYRAASILLTFSGLIALGIAILSVF